MTNVLHFRGTNSIIVADLKIDDIERENRALLTAISELRDVPGSAWSITNLKKMVIDNNDELDNLDLFIRTWQRRVLRDGK